MKCYSMLYQCHPFNIELYRDTIVINVKCDKAALVSMRVRSWEMYRKPPVYCRYLANLVAILLQKVALVTLF